MNLDRIKDKTWLTFEEASTIWRADPHTGLLHWLPASGRAGLAGVRRVGMERCDYLHVGHGGHSFTVHRLVWLLCTGKWPEFVIDHISGDRHDNRLVNLRDVPHRINQLNQRYHREGTKKPDYRSKVSVTPSVTPAAASRYGESVTPRARTPLLTEGMSRRNAVTQTVTGRAASVTRDRDSLPPFGLRPSRSRPGPSISTIPNPSQMGSSTADLVKLCATRILANTAAGRIYDPRTVEWAERSLTGVIPRQPEPAHQSPARASSQGWPEFPGELRLADGEEELA